MRKRTFIKNSALAAAAVAMSTSFSSCKKAPPKASVNKKDLPSSKQRQMATKWMWYRPNIEADKDILKRELEKMKNAGIQAVLPQVYNSRFTLFDHPTIPVKKRWLESYIPIAHSFDIEVHAWMWTMPLNIQSYWEKHPDWFSVNRNGHPSHTHPAYVNYYKFLCPCHPEVQEFVANNVKALANIEDLDGIHLDYVRQPDVILAEALQPKYNIVQDKEYPEYDYPYSERCRNLFKAEYGKDPIELGNRAPDDADWRQFRYDAITNVVNNHCVPHAANANKAITAAVFPNWESVRQQWHNWDLDAFLPMLYNGFYNEGIEWIGHEITKGKSLLKSNKPISAGLFLNDMKEDYLRKTIDLITKAKGEGFALFSYHDMKENHWQLLNTLNHSK